MPIQRPANSRPLRLIQGQRPSPPAEPAGCRPDSVAPDFDGDLGSRPDGEMAEQVRAGDPWGAPRTTHRRGRAYVSLLTAAVTATLENDPDKAKRLVESADHLLGPLGDLEEADHVREFIAGAAMEIEMRIDRLAGVVSVRPFP